MVTRYDDTLVRKIIQNVSVYDDHFVIYFKSGIEMEVWFNTNINRQLRVRFVNVNIKMYKSDKIKMYNYSKLTWFFNR